MLSLPDLAFRMNIFPDEVFAAYYGRWYAPLSEAGYSYEEIADLSGVVTRLAESRGTMDDDSVIAIEKEVMAEAGL